MTELGDNGRGVKIYVNQIGEIILKEIASAVEIKITPVTQGVLRMTWQMGVAFPTTIANKPAIQVVAGDFIRRY